jgi:hypothetical protein
MATFGIMKSFVPIKNSLFGLKHFTYFDLSDNLSVVKLKTYLAGFLLSWFLLYRYRYTLPIPTGANIVKTNISIYNRTYRFLLYWYRYSHANMFNF